MSNLGVPAAPSGHSRAEPEEVSALRASVPNAAAINVSAGLYLDTTGDTYPVTNWFDEDGYECPREDAVACVAGAGGCWFALSIADFSETGARV